MPCFKQYFFFIFLLYIFRFLDFVLSSILLFLYFCIFQPFDISISLFLQFAILCFYIFPSEFPSLLKYIQLGGGGGGGGGGGLNVEQY